MSSANKIKELQADLHIARLQLEQLERDKFYEELRKTTEKAIQDAEHASMYRWLRGNACIGYPSGEGASRKDAYLVVTGYMTERDPLLVDNAVRDMMKKV